MSNPLLNPQFRIPFDEIRAEHVEPAIEQVLAECRRALDQLASSPGPRTYANTLQPFDMFSERLDYAMGVARHLEAVATYPELREAYNKVQSPVAEFLAGVPLNEGLWKVIKEYASTEEARSLTGARKRFLTKTVDTFIRQGANLDSAGKERLQQIDIELAQITTKYSQNVLDSTNEFELILTAPEQLAGLPESAIAAARASAESKGKQGWRFTLQAPSYVPVMTYLDDASVREAMYLAFNQRATREPHDNRALIVRILELRRERANLLGFKDFADLVLNERMAHNGQAAQLFLDRILERTREFFQRENRELMAFAGRAELPAWDLGYYGEKQRLKLFEFDEEELRPYFPVDQVMAGMFELFRRLFGIRVAQEDGVPGWDPHVKYYRIEDESSGESLGGFYADWYPRENKRGGAWMDALIVGNPKEGKPHLGLICGNMTPPVDGKPALLTHDEVETIFHEFGHLLHHCLSRVEVRSLAGTSVPWDFVELPSQIMQNWCWERESLDMFARHYETGAPIPEDLYQKMIRARNYRSANAQMRQLSFGFADLALHRQYDPAIDGDVIAYTRRLMESFSASKLPLEHSMITAFTHLFASPVAYAAGYYSYKWAEVLDADAFTRFQKEGVFNRETGIDFRNQILAKGDSEDPADLYRAFMGRDPDVNALFTRSGLVEVEQVTA